MNPVQDRSIFKLEHRDAGLAILWMDDPSQSVNTLKRELIAELERVLDTVEADREIEVLVFASGKHDSFVAGADLKMLLDITEAEEGRELSQASQGIQRRIAALKVVTVAAIHGACLGGGLELTLAFDGRVASEHPKSRLGLPEVQLGLLPGGGGTQRLPALLGIERGLDMLLTGRTLNAMAARRCGLVDECVHPGILIEAAAKRGQELAERPKPASPWRRIGSGLSIQSIRNWVLGENPVGRHLTFDQARQRTLRKTRGNYPAPMRILEVVKTGLESGSEQGEAAEATAFGELAISPEARELIRLFFAKNSLKKNTGTSDPTAEPQAVNKIGVLGGGLMGAGIALVSVSKAEATVRLKDINDDQVGHGLKYARDALEKRVQRYSITPLERDRYLSRLTGTLDYSGFDNCQVVVEAVLEDLDLKRQIVAEVQQRTGNRTIFASNTSALPIAEIGRDSRRPENIVGMHYFSPVEKMPLLEIVVSDRTAPWVTATCVELGRRQGKTVIVVHDGPGFFTSRILGPYINEAAHLLAEGAPIDVIDEALLDFGFPIGPMALLDAVGIDVGHKVSRTLFEAFGERLSPAPGFDKLMDDKRLGKKNRRGFYLYAENGAKHGKQVDESIYSLLGVSPANDFDRRDIAERCVLQMINEAVHCLGDNILDNPIDGDIGAVFGLGFPPFRGGPFRYLDNTGSTGVLERLNRLAERYGERFRPAPLLVEKGRDNASFHEPIGQ